MVPIRQRIKSGYMWHLVDGIKSSWKKTYFVLTEGSLTYYTDHDSLSDAVAKGDILLVPDSRVQTLTLPDHPYSMIITTAFNSLIVAASSLEELDNWMKQMHCVITQAHRIIRGYITQKGLGGSDIGTSRRFFVLHSTAVTWHQDHENTNITLGSFELTPDAVLALDDNQCEIRLSVADKGFVLCLCFESDSREYILWRDGIMKLLKQSSAVELETQRRIEETIGAAIKRGILHVSLRAGGINAQKMIMVLTAAELLLLRRNRETGKLEVLALLELRPSCSVFETNLSDHAFEIVTPKQVVHVLAVSRKECTDWMHALLSAISKSHPEANDPLVSLALQKIDEDVFYDVSFHEKRPLGVVFEKSSEWAIIKHSNSRATGVHIGSVLTSINGQSCMLSTYTRSKSLLRGWQPPLHLGFRRAPHKAGYLGTLTRERRGKVQSTWKERYFILDEGSLLYKNSAGVDEPVKAELRLIGSAVSLVSSTETGKFFCFRVVSGLDCMVMQAIDMEEMMDWAATLYHASAIANGGAHIIAEERKRLQPEDVEDVKHMCGVSAPTNGHRIERPEMSDVWAVHGAMASH